VLIIDDKLPMKRVAIGFVQLIDWVVLEMSQCGESLELNLSFDLIEST